MSELFISSAQNAKIKFAFNLRNRKEREQHQLYVIEGYRELRRYLCNRVDRKWFPPWRYLFYCPEMFLGDQEPEIIQRARDWGTEIVRTTQRVFAKLAYRDRPEGLLAIAHQKHRSLDSLHLSHRPLVAIAEGIEKPGNLGTLLRCADGAGVEAFILSEHQTDLWNPNVVRASTGVLFSLPIVATTNQSVWKWLNDRNLRVIAAHPDAESSAYTSDLCDTGAIVLGSEQVGLSDFWLARSHRKVALPMNGSADSLNVAIAGALLFYEVLRQRSKA